MLQLAPVHNQINFKWEHETDVNILISAYSTFLELQPHTTTIHILSLPDPSSEDNIH